MICIGAEPAWRQNAGGWAAHPHRHGQQDVADRRGGRSALVLVGFLVLCQVVGKPQVWRMMDAAGAKIDLDDARRLL